MVGTRTKVNPIRQSVVDQAIQILATLPDRTTAEAANAINETRQLSLSSLLETGSHY